VPASGRQEHDKGHWMSVAVAREQGVALPAAELIRVGDLSSATATTASRQLGPGARRLSTQR
jgi:hypothetical protein